MTLPAWPACLPSPLIGGYTVSMGDANNVRTSGSIGPILSRNRQTRQTATVAVSYVMNYIQFAIFEAWYHWIANDGHSWFTATQAGEGTETNTCRFNGGYSASFQSDHWLVNGELLIDEPYRGS